MSMFSRCDKLMNSDPFEEIFALNLGDFLTEHLISDELAFKIKNKISSEPVNLKQQLKELISIYSIDNTLKVLGLGSKEDYVIYNSIANAIIQMVDSDACHIFLSKERMRGNIEKDLFVAGSTEDLLQNSSYCLGYNLEDTSAVVEAFCSQKAIIGISGADYNPIKELENKETKSYAIFPMSHLGSSVGVIVIEKKQDEKFVDEYFDLVQSMANLFATSLHLQSLTEEASVLITLEDTNIAILKHLRTELTVTIGELGDAQQAFVKQLANAVDIKGAYSRKHSQAVATLAKKLCSQLQLNEKT